jgi:hypothetical protein
MKTYIENPNPELYNLLKWMNNCTSKNLERQHPVLNCVHITRFMLEASNGFIAVRAYIEAPIGFYANIEEGIYYIESVTKKLIVMDKRGGDTFVPLDQIITGLHLPEKHTLACVNPYLFDLVTKGFDKAFINIHGDRYPIEIVLKGDAMPDGTYLAILMPMHSEAAIEAVMTDAFSKLVSDEH